jgi:cytochrome b pre-mRNA-processing protein 3
LAGFFPGRGRRRHERIGFELYAAAVAAAREPALYLEVGVPDTLDGRFDVIGLHVFLLIHRLTGAPEPGPALAQAVFDAMFGDMDVNLREMGVGDLSVGKKVKAMWEAFHGRAAAYAAALDADDPAVLEAALRRNVWRRVPAPDHGPAMLARLARAQSAYLAGQQLAALAAGRARFLTPAEAIR